MSEASCRAVHPDFPEYVCLKQAHGKDYAHSNGQGISWTEESYVPTQEAVDWARQTVLRSVEKFRRWEKEAAAEGEPERAKRWRAMAYMFEHELIGGGCVIGPFHSDVVRLSAEMEALRNA